MSIYNTQVQVLKTEISTLKKALLNKQRNKHILEQCAPNLLLTSKTLFNMIITNYQNTDIDEKINKMLDLVLKIQRKEISQYDASGIVGTQLAKQYINAVKQSDA